jgi:hypothetical protein
MINQSKYYRNSSNQYIGAFSSPPENGFEVPSAPLYYNQIWDGESQSWLGGMPPDPISLVRKLAQEYVLGDPDIPLEVFALCDVLRFGGYSEPLRKGFYARILALNPAWLTPNFKAKMEAWSAACGMPLV